MQITTLPKWLTETCKAHDVQPCIVTIEGQQWPACFYRQTASETYIKSRIYAVGALPLCYQPKRKVHPVENLCFAHEASGLDWYVAGYYYVAGAKKSVKPEPEHEALNPFGPSFVLAPWDLPEAIDAHELKPYTRVALSVAPEIPSVKNEKKALP